jgi:hypothetical protein
VVEDAKRYCCDGLCEQGRTCPARKSDVDVNNVNNANSSVARIRLPESIEPERFMGQFILIAGSFLVVFFILLLFYLAYTS